MIALKRMWAEDDAQDLIEYGLIALLLAITAIVAVEGVGVALADSWSAVATKLSAAI